MLRFVSSNNVRSLARTTGSLTRIPMRGFSSSSGDGDKPPDKRIIKPTPGHYLPQQSWLTRLLDKLREAKKNYYTPKDFSLPFSMSGMTTYRADSRSPSGLGPGFEAKGTNQDLSSYARRNVPSIYVPSALTEQAALNFGVLASGIRGNDHFYLYEITRVRLGVVLSEFFYFNPFPDQEELAIVGGVPLQNIRRFRRVEADGTAGPWILNPHYVPYDYETGEGLGP